MDPYHDRTDEELLEDYAHGETGAFRALIARHHDTLLRFLTRLLGERESAEDVFQDTFLQVHESLHTFDMSRRFKPWLFTIAANKARDVMRRRQRRPTVSLSAPVQAGGGVGAFVDLMELDTPDVSSDAEREELRLQVEAAIDAMPPRLREVLLMAYFQRLSYQQISDIYDIPLGTVKSRLHAAVAAFARKWQEQRQAAVRAAGREPGSA